MKKMILVLIGCLPLLNAFATNEVTVKIEGCTIAYYNEIIGLLDDEDRKQQLGMFSQKCSRGILTERRVGTTTIETKYGFDYSNDCSLVATRTYYCHQLPW